MQLTQTIGLAVLVPVALAACQAVPSGLFEGGAGPAAEAEPTPITKTLCESGAELRTDVEFLRAVEVDEDGVVQLVVAVDAALGESRTLAQLADEVYGPLVDDVIVSLQDLRDIAEELEGQATLGAGIATVGEAITAIGESMDTLTLALREPCPEGE
jgi:hypothetical protein